MRVGVNGNVSGLVIVFGSSRFVQKISSEHDLK